MKQHFWSLLCAAILSACQGDQPKDMGMNTLEPSLEMKMREARKKDLISPDIALKLAEMVFRENYGEAALANQLPLTVRDRDEAWQVEGTFRRYSSLDLKDSEGGQIIIVIRKLNGQILDFTRLMILPQSGIPLPPNPPPSPPPT